MELGYNTDVTLEGGTFHVQTEGRLDSHPRIDTLVYRKGAVLQRVSNPDPDLGVDDLRIEETKRKIRDQHLSVLGLVRRSEFDKVPAVRPAQTAFGFIDLLPAAVSPEWRDVLLGRHEVVFDEWKKGLADALGLSTPSPRYRELRAIFEAFARFLDDEAVPFDRKQSLLSYLLRLDARFKAIDVYEALRKERGEVPAYGSLIAALKRGTDRLVDLLVLQASSESALSRELLLDLFTRQSMDMVKYLFEEAEKKLDAERHEGREALPAVLLYLEEKVSSENIPTKELDDLFDRLNYLYARLSVKAVREISANISRIRDERGVQTRLRPEQKQTVSEYVSYLERCKSDIEHAWALEQKLARINEFKTVIDAWDKVLRLSIGVRLALKGYHNFVTVNILETAELTAMKMRRLAPTLPGPTRSVVEPVLRELQTALDANMNVRRIVVPAIKAQEMLAALDVAPPVSPSAPVEEEETLETILLADEAPPTEEMSVPAGNPDETRRMTRLPKELIRRAAPGALATKEPPPAPTPRSVPEVAAAAATEAPAAARVAAPAPPLATLAVPVLDGAHAQARAIEDRIKVGALGLLKCIEELTRAVEDLSRLEASEQNDEALRARLLGCRKELAVKKKVLQHKLASL